MICQEPMTISAVFRIEELVLQISDAVDDHGDKVSLATTCSHLFRLLVPQLWENINGVEKLFALIPGADVREDTASPDSSESPHRQLTITIPEPPYHNDLSRFHMYCAFVKHLDIVGFDMAFDLQNSDSVSHLAAPGLMLLPNLLSLTLDTVAGYCGERIQWLSELVSPCLQSFRLAVSGDLGCAFTTPEDHNTILDVLAQRCPNLRELDLMLYSRNFRSRNDPDANLRMWLERPVRVSRIAGLRNLSVSALYVRAGGLEVFSTLPLLEDLTLGLVPLFWSDAIPNTLSESSYPSLKRLSLLQVQSRRVLTRIWKLFAHNKTLTTFEVAYWLPYLRQAQREVVSILCRERSSLENLTLHQTVSRYPDDHSKIILAMAPLSLLPLRTLRIIISEKAPLDVDNLLGEIQQSGFRILQTLSISSVPLTLSLLAALAQSMPKLERLEAQVDFSSIDTIQPASGPTPSVFHTLVVEHWNEDMKVVETSLCSQWFADDDAEKIASFLAGLWPNVQIHINASGVTGNEKRESEAKEAIQIVGLLNRRISALASPNSRADPFTGAADTDGCLTLEESWTKSLALE